MFNFSKQVFSLLWLSTYLSPVWSRQGRILRDQLYIKLRKNILIFKLNYFVLLVTYLKKWLHFIPVANLSYHGVLKPSVSSKYYLNFFTFRIVEEETYVCQESTGCKTKKLYKMLQIRLLLAQWNLVSLLDVKLCSCCLYNMSYMCYVKCVCLYN